jgi:hypothetical protein
MRRSSIVILGAALGAGLFGVGCGSSNGSSPSNDAGETADVSRGEDTGTAEASSPIDAGSDAKEMEAAGYPAFVPNDVPQVVSGGGPVMAAPKVVPIFYAADDASTVASLQDFLSKLPGSTYWKGWISEYAVGDVTIGTPITITDTLPSSWDDSQIQADLAARIAANTLPAPDANTIYTFFYPTGVTITTGATVPTGDGGTGDAGTSDAGASDAGASLGGGVSSSCTSFGGYHDNITLSNNMDVAYAVVPRCATFGPLSGIDAITGPASHELAEAASDPFPFTNAAYATVDNPHFYWTRLLGGGEVGDMCAQLDDSFVKTIPGMPYTVQRIWSNKAAMAGNDPCLPYPPGNVNFNTYPVMPDTVTISSRGTNVQTKGADIPVGANKVIEFDLASSGPTSGPWTVKVIDSSQTGSQYVTAAFQECQGQPTCQGDNGQKLHVTLSVVSVARRNYEPFLIESKLASGDYKLWAGVISSPPDGG